MAEPQQEDYYNYNYHTQSQTTKQNPSASQILTLTTLVLFGSSLLIIAGLTLTATVVGLAVTTPLFVIFSPVLVPAALVTGLALAGFLTSGAFGVTSISSFAWLASYLRRSRLPEQLQQYVKPSPEDTVAQRAEEAGDNSESKAQETGQQAQSDAREAGKAQKENKASS